MTFYWHLQFAGAFAKTLARGRAFSTRSLQPQWISSPSPVSVRIGSILSVRNCTCAWANSQQAHKANPRATNFKSVINVSPAVDAFR